VALPFTRDYWSAAMLLRWVLTRNEAAVLAMLDRYGAVERGLGDKWIRTLPETWETVAKTYANPEEVRTEEGLAKALFRFEHEVIPCQNEIHTALRSGKLENWVQPNGSGNLMEGDRVGWMQRALRSYGGHDLAIPINPRDLSPAPLPYHLAHYLTGNVSSSVTPSVWVDPSFLAEQAKKLWRPSAEATRRRSGGSINVESSLTDGSSDTLPESKFVGWMRGEKVKYGSYPPRSPPEKSDRESFEKWASDHDILRRDARAWVKKHGLSNGRGAPVKKIGTK
jgi:hypothetical protein